MRKTTTAFVLSLVAAGCYQHQSTTHTARAAAEVRKGNEAVIRGELSVARLCFNSALQADPACADAHIGLGVIWATSDLGAEGFRKALTEYDKALALNPKSSKALSLRGAAKTELGQAADAMEDLNRAIELDAENGYALLIRSECHFKLGDRRQSDRDYDRAVAIDPTYRNTKRPTAR